MKKGYWVTITDRRSNETRSVFCNYEWDPDGSDYVWSEGNYACD